MKNVRKLFAQRSKIFTISVLCICFLFFSSKVLAAGTPTILSFQGRLADSSGNLLGGSGTDYYFKFSIWNSPTVGSGVKLWPTTSPSSATSTVRQGVFTINIGDTAAGYPDVLDYNFSSASDIYLQIEVSPDNGTSTFQTLAPRQRITAAAFARLSGAVSGADTPSTFGTTTANAGTQVTIEATSTNSILLALRARAGQLANLFQIQNTSGSNLFSIDANGGIFGASTFNILGTSTLATTTATTLTVSGPTVLGIASTTAVTAATLYAPTLGSNVAPSADTTFSLGTNALRFLNLFAQNVFASSSVVTNATSTNLYASKFSGAGLVTSCADPSGKLLWDATTGTFSCGVDAGAGSGISTINGLTAAGQTFVPVATTTGTDFSITNNGASIHWFNIPDASLTARGFVSTTSQSFAGVKTFTDLITTNASTTALTIAGSLFDSLASRGASGQVLLSSGTSTLWTSTSSLGLVGNAYASSTFPNFAYGTSTYALLSSLAPYVPFTYASSTYATIASLSSYSTFAYASSTFPSFDYASSSYYLASNPSGFITSGALSSYPTFTYASSTFAPIATTVTNTYASTTFPTFSYASSTFASTSWVLATYPSLTYASSTYYLASNPSSYITATALTPYVPFTYGSSTYSTFAYGSSTFPTFAYATNTFATNASLASYPSLTYASSTFVSFPYASSTFSTFIYSSSTFPTFTYATSTFAPVTTTVTNSYASSTFSTFTYGSSTFPSLTYASSTYYLASNPSSYITATALTPYVPFTYGSSTFPTFTYSSSTFPTFTYASSTFAPIATTVTNAYASSTFPTFTYATSTFVAVIGNQNIAGDKTFSGTSTLATTTVSQFTATGQTILANASTTGLTSSGTLNVTGKTVLGVASTSVLTATDLFASGNLAVTGTANLTGKLTMTTGSSTIFTSTGLFSSGTLNVAGQSNLATASTTDLTTTGYHVVTGTSTLATTTATLFTVSGQTSLANASSSAGITAATFYGAGTGLTGTASGLTAGLISSQGSLATLNAAPAGTLTGTTLNSTVVTSSLTSVGILTGLTVSGQTSLATASSTGLTATNLYSTLAKITNASTTGLTVLGNLYDSVQSQGTLGMVLQATGTSTIWVATSSLGISGGSGVTGGINGYLARFTSPTNLSTGLFLDDATVSGVNATSSSYTFNLQASPATNPFNVASSSGASFFNIDTTGKLTFGNASTTGLTSSGTLNVTGPTVLGIASTTAVTAATLYAPTLGSNVAPSADTTFSLGTNALRFLNLFAQNVFASSSVVTNATSTNLYASKFSGAGLVTSCADPSGKLLWDATTGTFSCGVDAGAGGGITTLNGLTNSNQTLVAVATTTGTDFSITNNGASIHWFNIPDASLTARGFVSTTSQSFAGVKTFTDLITTNGTSTNLFSSIGNFLSASINTLTGESITATSSLTSNGTLVVSGTSTLATTTVSQFTATGQTILANASTTGLTSSGTLNVTGKTVLGVASTSDLTTTGYHVVTGTSTLATTTATALTSTTLNVSGQTTLAAASSTGLTVSGSSTLATTTSTKLDVTGQTTLGNASSTVLTGTTFWSTLANIVTGNFTHLVTTNATTTNASTTNGTIDNLFSTNGIFSTSLTSNGTLNVIGQSSLATASSTGLTLTGSLYDSILTRGTNGQILLSSGTSTLWTSTSSLGLVTYPYASSTYYLASNPSSYITATALTPYVPFTYGSSTFSTFTYGSSTFPTFTYASSTFAPIATTVTNAYASSTFPSFTYATSTFSTFAYGSSTFPTFTYATSTFVAIIILRTPSTPTSETILQEPK
jgi:hypothetical protein